MRTVRINKGDLVNALTENRKKHILEYNQACEGYRADILAFLHNCAVRLEKGEVVKVIVEDMPPNSHVEDYDAALKMLEMSVDNVIELTDEEFRHMVMDDWDWRRQWVAANTKYLVHRHA